MFYPINNKVPEKIETAEFIVRPLRTSDVELDYDAVISSRAELWLRSNGNWPREGFTLEENLQDLEMHQNEHDQGIAFTYTVMNRSQTECLGCIYINPLYRMFKRVGSDATQFSQIGEHEGWVTFWVRQNRLAENLDVRLLQALLKWFRGEWALSKILVTATIKQERQQRLFEEATLPLVYSFDTMKAYLILG